MTKKIDDPNHATDPAIGAVEVTPSDDTDLSNRDCRALYVGTTGNVKVKLVTGENITFVNVPSGMILPVMVKRVFSTGTVASDIVALY